MCIFIKSIYLYRATDKQRKLSSQRTASRRRLLQIGSVKSSRMPLDFIGVREMSNCGLLKIFFCLLGT